MPAPPEAATIPVPPELPATEIPPEEFTVTAPLLVATMPAPPLVREMLLDDATLTGSVSSETALIAMAALPAKDIAPDEITVTPPPTVAPPISEASIASPAPVIEIGPDEFTVTPIPAVASIPVPSPVMDMAPLEARMSVPSVKAVMPVPPCAREMSLDDATLTAPPANEDTLIPLAKRPLMEMLPEVVTLTAPPLVATMPSTKSCEIFILKGPVALLRVRSPAPEEKNKIPGFPLPLAGAILLVNELTLRTLVVGGTSAWIATPADWLPEQVTVPTPVHGS